MKFIKLRKSFLYAVPSLKLRLLTTSVEQMNDINY